MTAIVALNINETKNNLSSLETEVIQSFYTEDITENQDKLNLAFLMVAKGYARLSSQEINYQEIYQELCKDEYHIQGLSRVLLLSGYNPDTDRVEPLGTMRIVLASEQAQTLGLAPIEAMSLFLPKDGWENFEFAGFKLKYVTELTRFAVTKLSRNGRARNIQLPSLVLNKLTRDAILIARKNYNRSQAWGIMPRYIVKMYEAVGIKLIASPEVKINYQNCTILANKYNKYWLRSNPAFYKVIAKDSSIPYLAEMKGLQQ